MVQKAINMADDTIVDFILVTDYNIESEEVKDFLGDHFICTCINQTRDNKSDKFIVTNVKIDNMNIIIKPTNIIIKNKDELSFTTRESFDSNYCYVRDTLTNIDMYKYIKELEDTIDRLNTEIEIYKQKEFVFPTGPAIPIQPIRPCDPTPYYPQTPWTPCSPWTPCNPRDYIITYTSKT